MPTFLYLFIVNRELNTFYALGCDVPHCSRKLISVLSIEITAFKDGHVADTRVAQGRWLRSIQSGLSTSRTSSHLDLSVLVPLLLMGPNTSSNYLEVDPF